MSEYAGSEVKVEVIPQKGGAKTELAAAESGLAGVRLTNVVLKPDDRNVFLPYAIAETVLKGLVGTKTLIGNIVNPRFGKPVIMVKKVEE
jgi:hypothetical protein